MTLKQGSAPTVNRVPLRKDPIFWFVLALGLAYGAVFNFLPTTFPIFRHFFGVTLEQLGRTQLLFFVSFLVFSFCGGWSIGRLGLRPAALVSLLLLAIGLVTIGGARRFGMVLLGAFLLGLAIAAIVVVCWSTINDHFGERRQSAFFAFGLCDAAGSTIGPAFLGKWLGFAEAHGADWRTGYYATAALIALLVVWGALLRSESFPSQRSGLPDQVGSLSAIKQILTKPTIYAIGLAIFLHGVAQMGMVSWTGQLYQKRLGIDAAHAAYFISVNSCGFFAGRSVLSWITARWKIPELLVLGICASGGTLAFAGTIASGSYRSGIIMFIVAGVFISGDAPSIQSYLGARSAGESATAYSLMNGMGNLGGGAGPYLIGVIGNQLGLETGIWLMPIFCLALATLALGWFFKQRVRREPTPALVSPVGPRLSE